MLLGRTTTLSSARPQKKQKEAAIRAAIDKYTPYIHTIAKRRLSFGLAQLTTIDDLINVGREAVWEAIARQKGELTPEKLDIRIKFLIINRIIDYIRDIAGSKRELNPGILAMQRYCQSLDQPSKNPGNGDSRLLAELIPDQETPLPDARMLAKKALEFFDLLTDEEKEVLTLYFGLDPDQWEMTLVEIGTQRGVSDARICQIKRDALAVLKLAMAGQIKERVRVKRKLPAIISALEAMCEEVAAGKAKLATLHELAIVLGVDPPSAQKWKKEDARFAELAKKCVAG